MFPNLNLQTSNRPTHNNSFPISLGTCKDITLIPLSRDLITNHSFKVQKQHQLLKRLHHYPQKQSATHSNTINYLKMLRQFLCSEDKVTRPSQKQANSHNYSLLQPSFNNEDQKYRSLPKRKLLIDPRNSVQRNEQQNLARQYLLSRKNHKNRANLLSQDQKFNEERSPLKQNNKQNIYTEITSLYRQQFNPMTSVTVQHQKEERWTRPKKKFKTIKFSKVLSESRLREGGIKATTFKLKDVLSNLKGNQNYGERIQRSVKKSIIAKKSSNKV